MGEKVSPEFSRIHDAYHGRVLAYAAKLIGRDGAEEVTQEVFVKIGRSLGTLDDPDKLSSWIDTITLNTVRDLAESPRVPRGDVVARSRRCAIEDRCAPADLVTFGSVSIVLVHRGLGGVLGPGAARVTAFAARGTTALSWRRRDAHPADDPDALERPLFDPRLIAPMALRNRA